MRVEWTSYSSPIGALTIVECEAGPLVIEFPTRAGTIKWAVRLRAAVPELHIEQVGDRRAEVDARRECVALPLRYARHAHEERDVPAGRAGRCPTLPSWGDTV